MFFYVYRKIRKSFYLIEIIVEIHVVNIFKLKILIAIDIVDIKKIFIDFRIRTLVINIILKCSRSALEESPLRRLVARHTDLHKAESAIIVQARSGRIRFANFLCKARVPGFETPRCLCGLTDEISKYIFIECNRFRHARDFLRNDRD
jgi:hypothetical protein